MCTTVFQGDHRNLFYDRSHLIYHLIEIVAPVRHCQALLYILGSFVALCLSFTSLLFLYRLRAVYSNSKIIQGFFNLLWMVLVGSSVLVPLSLEGDVSSYPSLSAQGCAPSILPVFLSHVYSTWDQQIDASKPGYTNLVSQRTLLIPSMTPSSSLRSLTKSSQIQLLEITGRPALGRSIPPMDFRERRKLFYKVDSSTICDSNRHSSIYRFLIYIFQRYNWTQHHFRHYAHVT